MAPPLKFGVMQLTMEPLDEMLASARAMDGAGMDAIWLAEAYPWWRKHGMEARSSTGVGALMARETERLTIGWGIIAASTRHPVQAAMDARVVQEAAGPGRFILGFGTSKIFLNNTKTQTKKTLGPMRDAVTIARGVLSGERFDYDGDTWSADVPALAADAHAPREVPPVYVAATAPKMQQLAGEIADGCLTPSITTPAFVRYTRGNVGDEIDVGCTVVASIHESDRDSGRDGAREIAGITSRTRCRTSRAQPTRCSSSRGSSRKRSGPSPRRWSGAGASPQKPRSRTRSSTSAGRSRARPPTASTRSRSTATRAART
jgi:5,10-methylenetetrahydromethanopterin reductase